MSITATAQVQPKSDFTQQSLVVVGTPRGTLAENSVRVRTTILALSINNSAYAIGGSFLGWWDAAPVPSDFPTPYNDRETYGILNGWGFATVEESTLSSIQPGTLLKGYFPLSTVPLDLRLQPAKASGHFLEVSPHRAKLMHLYQRYVVTSGSASTPAEREALGQEALVGTLWECAYLVNRFSLSTSAPFINPGGENLPWTAADADLHDATVVTLAGSGKTALSFAHEFQHARAPGTGPQKVVAVTSAANIGFVTETKLYGAVLSYEQALADGAAALATLAAGSKRMVVLDFGARNAFTMDLHTALQARSADLSLIILRVGFENKPYTLDQIMADVFERGAKMGMVQMNASHLREQAIAAVGEETYFTEMEAAKHAFFQRGGIPGLKLTWSEGMTGPNGLEGAWTRLCAGGVAANEGVVVKL